jgi:hypothetical protein
MRVWKGGTKDQEVMILCSEEQAKLILAVVTTRRLDLKAKGGVKSSAKYYAVEHALELGGIKI